MMKWVCMTLRHSSVRGVLRFTRFLFVLFEQVLLWIRPSVCSFKVSVCLEKSSHCDLIEEISWILWNSNASLVSELTTNCEVFHDYWLNQQNSKHYFKANKGIFLFSDFFIFKSLINLRLFSSDQRVIIDHMRGQEFMFVSNNNNNNNCKLTM